MKLSNYHQHSAISLRSGRWLYELNTGLTSQVFLLESESQKDELVRHHFKVQLLIEPLMLFVMFLSLELLHEQQLNVIALLSITPLSLFLLNLGYKRLYSGSKYGATPRASSAQFFRLKHKLQVGEELESALARRSWVVTGLLASVLILIGSLGWSGKLPNPHSTNPYLYPLIELLGLWLCSSLYKIRRVRSELAQGVQEDD